MTTHKNLFRIATYVVSGAVLLSFAPAAASAAALTDAQVSSVVSLLQSFGVESSTIARVQATLSGKPSVGSGEGNHGQSQGNDDSDHGSVPSAVCRCPMLPAQASATASAAVASGGCGCSGTATSSPAVLCRIPVKDLDRGSKGDDVSELQSALGVEATGFFGPLTHSAVMKWQSENGLPSTGYFGSMSREKFKKWCGNPSPTLPQNTATLSVSPSSGAAPLSVSFTAGGLSSDGKYVINYGDGNNSGELKAECGVTATVGAKPMCSLSSPHTYTASGTYQATLSPYVACMYSTPVRCMIAAVLFASTTVTVQ